MRGNPAARQAWAVDQLAKAAVASRRLGLRAHASFSGALAWPYLYPWPQRPAGLVEDAFDELAQRWRPILDIFDDNGVDLAFEIHPGEDLHDGVTFEMFLDRVGNHPRASILYDPSHFVLQQLDYLQFIDIYHERIKCFHVKDAEFRPNGTLGRLRRLSGLGRIVRAASARSATGRSISSAIFSKLAQYDFPGWAVLEWECALKHPEDGCSRGRAVHRPTTSFRVTDHAFDDFAAGSTDRALNRRLMGFD